MFVCLLGSLTSSSTTRLYRGRGPKTERLTVLRVATHDTELGNHDFCLGRPHYTDTDPTSRERAATEGFEPGTSRSHALYRLSYPPPPCPVCSRDLCRRNIIFLPFKRSAVTLKKRNILLLSLIFHSENIVFIKF